MSCIVTCALGGDELYRPSSQLSIARNSIPFRLLSGLENDRRDEFSTTSIEERGETNESAESLLEILSQAYKFLSLFKLLLGVVPPLASWEEIADLTLGN